MSVPVDIFPASQFEQAAFAEPLAVALHATSLINDYKDYFNVSWPHLSVEFLNDENLSEIEKIWTDFEIGIVLTESENSTSISGRGHTVYYSIDHTNGIVIVDSDGYQRVRWDDTNWDVDGIKSDITKLLKEKSLIL